MSQRIQLLCSFYGNTEIQNSPLVLTCVSCLSERIKMYFCELHVSDNLKVLLLTNATCHNLCHNFMQLIVSNKEISQFSSVKFYAFTCVMLAHAVHSRTACIMWRMAFLQKLHYTKCVQVLKKTKYVEQLLCSCIAYFFSCSGGVAAQVLILPRHALLTAGFPQPLLSMARTLWQSRD